MSLKERKTYSSYSEYLKRSRDPGRPTCRRLKQSYNPGTPCCIPGSSQILDDNIFCNPTERTYDKCFNQALTYFNAGQYSNALSILKALRNVKKNDPEVLELLRDDNIVAINC